MCALVLNPRPCWPAIGTRPFCQLAALLLGKGAALAALADAALVLVGYRASGTSRGFSTHGCVCEQGVTQLASLLLAV